jgi:hypothetical protein
VIKFSSSLGRLCNNKLSRGLQEKTLYLRILKDIPCGAVIVILLNLPRLEGHLITNQPNVMLSLCYITVSEEVVSDSDIKKTGLIKMWCDDSIASHPTCVRRTRNIKATFPLKSLESCYG